MTRIAASDPDLWTEILDANAGPVLARARRARRRPRAGPRELRSIGVIGRVGRHQTRHRSAVDIATGHLHGALVERGNVGPAAALPGKHGGAPADVRRRPGRRARTDPGELARLFVASGEAGVNVEDVAIEHSPGQPVGLVELSVRPEAAGAGQRFAPTAGRSTPRAVLGRTERTGPAGSRPVVLRRPRRPRASTAQHTSGGAP